MEVRFDEMLGKLWSGEWERATTKSWQHNGGEFVTLKNRDGRRVLLFHESHNSVIGWTLNMADSINQSFIELKL